MLIGFFNFIDMRHSREAIIEPPGRACKVSPNDRSFLIEERSMRSLQFPAAINAAVDLISISNGQ